MKQMMKITAAFLLGTTAAQASGIDRSLTNYGILFEQGNYVELSYAAVRPSVSGTYTDPALIGLGGGATDTGVMSQDFNSLSGSLKYDLTPRLALGLFANQPYGADASYPGGAYQGLSAQWESSQLAIVMKYKATPNISVYGGVRSIESQPQIVIPNQLIGARVAQAQAAGAQQAADGARASAAGAQQAAAAAATATTPAQAAQFAAQAQTLGAQAAALQAQAQGLQAAALQTQSTLSLNNATTGPFTYRADTEKDRETSYILGAAYERPEIALRVALTYESGYTHKFRTTETLAAVPGISGSSITRVDMPDVYTLDFQSGVATDTLVFGSIRHATWSDWHVRPRGYEALTGDEVTGIDSDTTTYRIGVGRKFSDSISGFARVTYEPGNGDVASRLAPTDGSTAFGIGGTYTRDAFKITGGVEYITFGEATDASGTRFADNDAVAVGVSVGYRF